MKKTLIITLEFPPHIGGVATYVHDVAHALDPEKTIILAPKVPSDFKEEVQGEDRYQCIRKNLLFPRWLWPRWLKLCWLVWLICRKEKIELIMIHHILPAGYPAWLMRKFLKIPYLVFSHGTDIAAASRTKWKAFMAQKVALSSEQIVCNSDSLARRLLIRFPKLAGKVSVVYPCPQEIFINPVEPEKISELKQNLALQGKKVILSVARLVDGKGFPHLVRVMSEVVKINPTIVWIIIGTGPKLQQIITDVEKNNLQNIVRFIGDVPHDTMPPYFQAADLFILLTHPDNGQEEGLGLVFLEAAAAGLAAIAGKSGGVEEAIRNGQTGLVFDVYRESKSIVESIVTLLRDTSYRQSLGKNAQQRIKAEFNWPHQLERISPWLETPDNGK